MRLILVLAAALAALLLIPSAASAKGCAPFTMPATGLEAGRIEVGSDTSCRTAKRVILAIDRATKRREAVPSRVTVRGAVFTVRDRARTFSDGAGEYTQVSAVSGPRWVRFRMLS